MISAIGHFLAELPNARILYKDQVWPEEEVAEDSFWAEAEEEDVFGHGWAGLDDPDGHEQQGLHDKHDVPLAKENHEEGGHDWVWTGRSWQCFNCLRQTRNRGGTKHVQEYPPQS